MKKRAPSFRLEVRKAVREKIAYKLKSIVDAYAVTHPVEAEDLRAILNIESLGDDIRWDDRELSKIIVTNTDASKDYLLEKLVFGEGIKVIRYARTDYSTVEISIDVEVLDAMFKTTADSMIVSPYIDTPANDTTQLLAPFDVEGVVYTTVNIPPADINNAHLHSTLQIARDKYFTDIVATLEKGSDRAASDYFGRSCSVSSDGSTVVVGAYGDDDNGSASGAAYVFKWNSGTSQYDQAQKLTASDGAADDYFGYNCSVSSDGSTVVVGACFDDDNGSYSGSAYVFRWNSGTSQYDEAQKLTASDGAAGDYFGYSCSVSSDGSTIVIGAHGDDDNGTDSGSAYVFKWNSGTSQYDQAHKLTASDGAADDQFGWNCSVSGDGSAVVVGARYDDDNGSNSGSAYVFKWNSGTSQYDEAQKLTASDGAADDYFGYSCSVSSDGSTIVIGAHGDDDNGSASGSAYVFKWNSGTSQYDEAQKLTASDGAADDQFGLSCSVSSDGSAVVIGAYCDDDNGSNSGSAYVFKWNSGTSQYDQAHKLTASDGVVNDYFGLSCSVSGDGSAIVVGAPYSVKIATDAGEGYVFKLNGTTDQYDQIQRMFPIVVDLNVIEIDDTVGLDTETSYYIRMKYASIDYTSRWGLANRITTGLKGIVRPTILRPVAGVSDVAMSDYIDASAYTASNMSETHVSTDWQIATDDQFANMVYESLADTTNLESIGSLSGLGLDTSSTYYVRCRYNSATYTSKWSSSNVFTTEMIGIAKPIVISPSNGAVGVYGDSMIDGSPYDNVNQSETHLSSSWQIATDSSFTGVVVNIVDDETNLTSIGDLDSLGLTRGVMYFVRVKYKSATYESVWSDTSNFTAIVQSINTPSIITPVNNAVGVPGSELVTSSAYSGYNQTEPHLSTDWQVATDAGFTTVVFQSLADTDHLTSIGTLKLLMELLESTEYYVRCKYNSATYSSDWSAAVHFTTIDVFLVNEIQKLLASDGVADDNFGISCSVSSDSSTVVVGAYGDDDNGSASGSAYIFKWNSGTSQYDEVQKLTASDGTDSDAFGYNCSVSSDGSTVVVGATGDDDNGSNSGSAYVFKWNSGTSQYDEAQKLTASDGAADDRFGWNCVVSSDGSTVVVGSYRYINYNDNSKAVYAFKWNSGTSQYDEVQKLLHSNPIASDWFGWNCSVSDDGSIITAGACVNNDSYSVANGSVYVYKWNSGTSQYDEIQRLTASDGAIADSFGISCPISGDGLTIVIGAHKNDDKGSESGSVYVFKWNSGTSQYDEIQKLLASDGTSSDQLGWSCGVTTDGSVIVSGAGHKDTINGVGSGSAYVFEWNSGTSQYDEILKLVASDGSADDYFGGSCTISSDTRYATLVGCVKDDDNGSNSGSVYVYK